MTILTKGKKMKVKVVIDDDVDEKEKDESESEIDDDDDDDDDVRNNNNNNNKIVNKPKKERKLTDIFVVPPISVLDVKQGYWKKQRKMWFEDFGISKTCDGRKENALKLSKLMAKKQKTTSVFDPVVCEVAYTNGFLQSAMIFTIHLLVAQLEEWLLVFWKEHILALTSGQNKLMKMTTI